MLIVKFSKTYGLGFAFILNTTTKASLPKKLL